MNRNKKSAIKTPSLLEALIVIVTLIILLYSNVLVFGDEASSGPNQIALILVSSIVVSSSILRRISWNTLQDGVSNNIKDAFPALLILLLVGSLIGTWIISGIVPTFIYYGLDLINPKIFLVTACIVSTIVSITIGSSWTTTGTVGVALMGIGSVLGVFEGYTAGAVLSGAYFGDKMSPLSDTTNLAPAMAGTTLFKHIRYMMLTTFPTYTITLIIFFILGFGAYESTSTKDILEFQHHIDKLYYISPILLIVPVGIFCMLFKKVPAVPSLIIGAVGGSIFALIFQMDLLVSLSNLEESRSIFAKAFEVTYRSWFGALEIKSENEIVHNLLKSKGMIGMLNTVWLIITAMIFGGVLEKGGYLTTFKIYLLKIIKTHASLITTTAGTCIAFNVLASDQYVSIVVPGRMFKELYEDYELAPENLSRTLEDSATVTSVLVPWNTCGAFQSTTLGVSTLTYLPYCFFNIISPIMTVAFAYLKIRIKKLDKDTSPKKNSD